MTASDPRGGGHPLLHFSSAVVSKVAPVAVQVFLLFYVARVGTLDDVGILALASAMSFLCAAVAEFGYGTSLSAPSAYFDTAHPPLRATKLIRVGAALGGSVLYLALWAAGLGHHNPELLILAPLPPVLALALGYAGVLNASRRLEVEARMTILESAGILLAALSLSLVLPGLTAALLGLLIGRAAGTAGRAWLIRSLPQSDVERGTKLVRAQLLFVPATLLIVVQGQADVLTLGFVGTLALVGIYSPMIRIVYAPSLLAEGVSWALYPGGPKLTDDDAPHVLHGHWYRGAIATGLLMAAIVALLGGFALDLILHRDVSVFPALQILALVIPVRFFSFAQSVAIVRAGRQEARVPYLAVALAVLVLGSVIGGLERSLVLLAVSRLVAELCIAGGYTRVVGQLPSPRMAGSTT